ncbi:MAG: Fic family protein [Thiobacillus sp.]|nr:Fic family protein [Thiobacillus sp.]
MKLPLSPPRLDKLMVKFDPAILAHMVSVPQPTLVEGAYLHWDELRHRPSPEGLSHEQWWLGIKLARLSQYQSLPLLDQTGQPFVFAMPEPVLRGLHFLDRDTAGQILTDSPTVTTAQDRDRYLFSSLIEEAITSSQLEGASTTRRVAEDMLRQGRKPRDLSERMIFNNFQAMQRIRALRQERLTPELILELHRMVALGTLEDPNDAGRLREQDDIQVVDQRDGQVLHIPPRSSDLRERLERLCAFANGSEQDSPYVHPILRAILLHFMLGYDHPFADGNGRTARALFYWSVARQGYWLMEYLSISNILRRAPGQYARAYLHTETDGNDTTYFLLHQLDVILQAVDALQKHLREKAKAAKATEKALESIIKGMRDRLNHRQVALLGHALKHADALYTIESHRRSHAVAYATARSDLVQLAAIGLLDEGRRGKSLIYTVPANLNQRLSTPFPSPGGMS